MTNHQDIRPEGNEMFWRSHLHSWQEGKLSRRAYCSANDIKPYQFKYWQYKLMPETKRTPKKKSPSDPSSPNTNFIEVHTHPLQGNQPLKKQNMELEIQTPHGVTLLIKGGIACDAVVSLVNLIKGLS